MPAKRTKKQTTGPQPISQRRSTEEPAAGNSASVEEIRYRAYEIYMKRGEQPGHDVDDWLEAERELQIVLKRA